MKNIPEIQLSEFDAINESDEFFKTHTLSKRYQKQKKNLLRAEHRRAISFRTALIAAIITILTVGGVYAAVSHTEFYKNLWGDTSERQDTPSKEIHYEVDKGYKSEGTITLPEKQYDNVDPEEAEDILGDHVMELPKSITVRDHTFTVISAVRDANCVVTEFTLECPTGVNALTYSEYSDYAHGATRSDEATFEFYLCGDKIYVDKERSTDTIWYCSMYSLLYTVPSTEDIDAYCMGELPDGIPITSPYAEDEKPAITFYTYDEDPTLPLLEGYLSETITTDDLDKQTFTLDTEGSLPTQVYTSESDGYLEISPLSIRINMYKGLGLDPISACDPALLESATVHYKDGSEYIVYSKAENIDNSANSMAMQNWNYMAFNSLVDTEQIEFIEVNGIAYYPGASNASENAVSQSAAQPENEPLSKEHIALGETGYYGGSWTTIRYGKTVTESHIVSYTIESYTVYDNIADAGITIDETAYGWEFEKYKQLEERGYYYTDQVQYLHSNYEQHLSKLPFVLAKIRIKFEEGVVYPDEPPICIDTFVPYSPLTNEHALQDELYHIYISDPVENGFYYELPLYEPGDEMVIEYGFVCTEDILESEQIWLVAGGNDDYYHDDVYFDLFE